MCGVCGMAGGPEGERISFVTASTATLSHRGPDAEGIEVLDGAVLGHTRLRILDLSEAGDQPMSCRNGTLWCSYNGEVYNFHDLRCELSAAGHRFETSSDTEVVLKGFDEWGTRVFSRLRGMFAVAVWDNRTRTLVWPRVGWAVQSPWRSTPPAHRCVRLGTAQDVIWRPSGFPLAVPVPAPGLGPWAPDHRGGDFRTVAREPPSLAGRANDGGILDRA